MLQLPECRKPLGMENNAIADELISASSQLDANHATSKGRLQLKADSNNVGSWSALTNDVNQWLQVDLGNEETTVPRVATQGSNAKDQWVTKYKLQHSYDGFKFQYYSESGQNESKVSYTFSL